MISYINKIKTDFIVLSIFDKHIDNDIFHIVFCSTKDLRLTIRLMFVSAAAWLSSRWGPSSHGGSKPMESRVVHMKIAGIDGCS